MLMQVMGHAAAWWLVWAPPELGGGAVPDEPDDVDWLLDGPWGKVAALLLAAGVVMLVANLLTRTNKRKRDLARPDFNLQVAKLEQLPISTIAAAARGEVHLEGVLELGDGALGTGAHACVYQNRYKASRATAIAAELALLSDGTGIVGLTSLEGARVIAPKEDHGPHDIVALYLGDRVEVVGEMLTFETPMTAGGRELRGMLGSLGPIQVRVTQRPDHSPHVAHPPSPSASQASSDPTENSETS
jgi:hypothetical protein